VSEASCGLVAKSSLMWQIVGTEPLLVTHALHMRLRQLSSAKPGPRFRPAVIEMESCLAWPSAVAPGVLAEAGAGAQLLALWRLGCRQRID
jgi:hypothetical protein